MIQGSLARRYARALVEVAIAKGSHERVGQEIDELAAAFEGSRDLAEAMTNPVFPRQQRRSVLEALLARQAVSTETKNFALLLLERERVVALPAIARELRIMVDEKLGRVRATVTSAKPLAPDQVAQIQSQLEKTSGKKVLLEKEVDPSLIGGVIAKLGDTVYDGSVRTQLERMREDIVSQG
jgi:F-type H+-transporting ATPase subunit delta